MKRQQYIDERVDFVKEELESWRKLGFDPHGNHLVICGFSRGPGDNYRMDYETILVSSSGLSKREGILTAEARYHNFAKSTTSTLYEKRNFWRYSSAKKYALERILVDSNIVARKNRLLLEVHDRVIADILGVNLDETYADFMSNGGSNGKT
jgi:hypothetical protein